MASIQVRGVRLRCIGEAGFGPLRFALRKMTDTMLTGLMMDDLQLSLTALVQRAEQLSATRPVVSLRPDGSLDRTTIGECARRARQLAGALAALGIGDGDRVATLLWNQAEHLELYYAERIEFIATIPRTATGKFKKTELRQRFALGVAK